MMGSSRSVVRTLSRDPSVKMVDRFLKEALLEKKRGQRSQGGDSDVVIRGCEGGTCDDVRVRE